MPATPFDSAIYGALFADREVAQLFTDSAEIRAMLIVEGALAKAQGALGMIPADAAKVIHRASLEATIDPAALRDATAANAVPVPALVAAFRTEIGDPEVAQYAHWGATSQDIVDTGLALRLRRLIELQDDALADTIAALATLAEDHRTTPMAGRTWGLAATPTTLGAVVASWGHPLIRARARLAALRPDLLAVSLSGAAGTLSAMGPDGPEVRADLAEALGLTNPDRSTHSTRGPQADFAAWMAATTGSLAKMAEDVLSMVRAGEAQLSGGGASSTMPQKANPVAAQTLVALARHAAALAGAMTAALPHRDQRDGTAWMLEWLTLPQLCIAATRAMSLATKVATTLSPNTDAMAHALDPDGLGLIEAEAITFALARTMRRPDAQTAVKTLCAEARSNGVRLSVLAQTRFPEANLTSITMDTLTGDAPFEADRFLRAAQSP